MHISPIGLFTANRTEQRKSIFNNNVTPIKTRQTLTGDTVSFKQSSIKDTIEMQHERNIEKYKVYADIFFDTLGDVADELSEFGVSFDRDYAKLNPIKSANSVSSKIARSGSFDVPDLIRTTLFVENPYDKSLIYEKFLPAMEKRGYILAKANGKPDIDFRLDEIGEPQASGYEDIQMRFVQKNIKNNKIKHELIILFGPNYANAKHLESEKVYSILRQFKEIHMDTNDAPIGSPAFKAKRYMELVKTQVQNKISKKLYDNAKNKDFYKIDDISPIYFTDENKKLMKNYFAALLDRTKDYYREKRNSAKSSEIAIIQLRKDEKDDLALIHYINDMLRETVKYFERNPQ